MTASRRAMPNREGMGERSPGQLAYEADCAARPLYHDGTPRQTWDQLPDHARESWRRNPTPRFR